MTGLLRQVARGYPALRQGDDSVFAESRVNPGGPMGPDGRGFGGRPDVDDGMIHPTRPIGPRIDPRVAPDQLGSPGRPGPNPAGYPEAEIDLLQLANGNGLLSGRPKFDPEGDDYDYDRAVSAGLGPDGTGENEGHWGSVAPATDEERERFGLPDEAYVILKGRNHPTFSKAVEAELARGFNVVKIEDRYYSVPAPTDE